MSDVASQFQALQAKAESIRTQKARAEGELAQLEEQLKGFGIENPEDTPAYLEKLQEEAAALDTFLHKRVEYLAKKLEA